MNRCKILVLPLLLAGLIGPVATFARADATDQIATEAEGVVRGDVKHEENPNPLVFNVDLAIWTAVVFLVMLLVLAKFAWGPIATALDAREQGIADNIQAAEDANEDAKRLLASYEEKLAQAADEVRMLLEEARRDAEHTKQEIVAEAQKAALQERNRAVHEIETAKIQALKELAERSADNAVELAGRIVGARLSKEDHTALIQSAMTRFSEVDPSKN